MIYEIRNNKLIKLMKLKIFRVILLIWHLETECWFYPHILLSKFSCTFYRSCAISLDFSSPHWLCCLSSPQPCHAVWCIYRESFYGWCELGRTSLGPHHSSPHSIHCIRVSSMELGCNSRKTGQIEKCIQCLYSWQDSKVSLSNQTSSIHKIWKISLEEYTFLSPQSNQQHPSLLYKCSVSIFLLINLKLWNCWFLSLLVGKDCIIDQIASLAHFLTLLPSVSQG